MQSPSPSWAETVDEFSVPGHLDPGHLELRQQNCQKQSRGPCLFRQQCFIEPVEDALVIEAARQ